MSDLGSTARVDYDSIGIADLRRRGGLKWTMYPDKIGAFVAEMDFPPAPPITAALHAAVDDGRFGYLPEDLARDMARACAAFNRSRYGWNVAATDVHPIADVVAGLTVAIEHFSAPGSPVILPTPAYMPFLDVPPAMGRELIEVPMWNESGYYSYDLAVLEAAFRMPGQLLILCNPHNPIGRVLHREEMVAIAAVVERCGGRVFSDEIHAPLVFNGNRHVPYASIDEVTAGHTVTALSASKAWNLPGMKCAQMIVSNHADAQKWAEVGFMAEHGAANLGVAANTVAFTSGGSWLDDVLDYLDGNRGLLAELVADQLPNVGYVPPEGTYLAWLDCRALGLDEPYQFFLDRAGVALVDGIRCGQAGKGFVRYNFATPRPIMIETIERMGKAVRER